MSDQELIPGKTAECQGRALGHGDGDREPPSQTAEPLSAGQHPLSAAGWGSPVPPPPKHSSAANGTTGAEEVTCRLEVGLGRHPLV